MPALSVVIPLHNGEPYLAAALDSVLAQSRPPDEVWVVDDGSSDAGAALAAAYGAPVHCLGQPRRGAAAARNAGVAASRGDWLAFLDADDLWLPGKLERQAALLEERPELDAVAGGWRNFPSPELDPATRARLAYPDGLHTTPIASTLLIRRERFLALGGFDETLASGEFIDWLLRARRAGLNIETPETLWVERRVHAHNHSLGREERGRAYLQLVMKRLAAGRDA